MVCQFISNAYDGKYNSEKVNMRRHTVLILLHCLNGKRCAHFYCAHLWLML